MALELNVIAYLAEECKRQQTGPEAVAWMAEAWEFAKTITLPLDIDDLRTIAAYVEPSKNRNGFRTVPVAVQLVEVDFEAGPVEHKCKVKDCPHRGPAPRKIVTVTQMPNWEHVEQMVEVLVSRQDTMAPVWLYRDLMDIHPWVDGNGRSGKIVLNTLNGTLDDPIWPPQFFLGQP